MQQRKGRATMTTSKTTDAQSSDQGQDDVPFLLPLSRPPRVTSRGIVGFRPPNIRYNRAKDLVRLVPLWPEDLAQTSIAGRRKLVQMLERALRAERQRGAGGHWTYDLSRHASLMWALRAERAALKALLAPRFRLAVAPVTPRRTQNTVTNPRPDLAGLP
jgi:Family of unknown function (DUF6477)